MVFTRRTFLKNLKEMASLVTEILSSAGALKKDELGTKVNALGRRITDLKTHVQDTLRVRYDEFLPVSVRTMELATKFDNYSNELDTLNNLIENELVPQMQESNEAFREVRHQLAVASEALQVTNRLVAVHEALESSESNIASLDKLKKLTDDLLRTWGDDNEILALSGLKIECTVRRERLMHDLNEIWKESIVWELNGNDSDGSHHDPSSSPAVPPVTILHVLKTRHEGSSSKTLDELIWSLHRLKYLEPKLKAFSQHLLKDVVGLILTKTVNVTQTSLDDDGEVTLKISVCSAARPCPGDVFAKLHTVFDFLNNTFESPPSSDRSPSTMRLIGDVFCTDFYDLLIKECLAPSVPSQRKDLDAFADVIEAATELQKRLVQISITDEKDDGILTYARNVDTLFADKMCQEILVKARNLMIAELHEAFVPPDAVACSSTEDTKSEEAPDYYLQKNFLKFPACQISKSTYKFVRLLYDVMEEATASSPLCSGRLLVTVRNAVEQYCMVVPTFHKDRLEDLPQQSAIFHNNCMYVAHHLMTLGNQFHKRLPCTTSDKEKIVTFIDQVPILRELGGEIFLAQMRRQRQHLLATMKDLGEAVVDAKLAPKIDQGMKRCVLHLQHLKAVWSDVLPSNIFNRALGTLVNSTLEDAVQRVVSLEDLPADGCTHLVAVFSVLKDQIPLLFLVSEDDEREIVAQRNVAKWHKFVEMLFVLVATLADIVDRWSDGKGPLAQQFTVDEIKRMIRALFQNTDRRAAALSKIK